MSNRKEKGNMQTSIPDVPSHSFNYSLFNDTHENVQDQFTPQFIYYQSNPYFCYNPSMYGANCSQPIIILHPPPQYSSIKRNFTDKSTEYELHNDDNKFKKKGDEIKQKKKSKDLNKEKITSSNFKVMICICSSFKDF